MREIVWLRCPEHGRFNTANILGTRQCACFLVLAYSRMGSRCYRWRVHREDFYRGVLACTERTGQRASSHGLRGTMGRAAISSSRNHSRAICIDTGDWPCICAVSNRSFIAASIASRRARSNALPDRPAAWHAALNSTEFPTAVTVISVMKSTPAIACRLVCAISMAWITVREDRGFPDPETKPSSRATEVWIPEEKLCPRALTKAEVVSTPGSGSIQATDRCDGVVPVASTFQCAPSRLTWTQSPSRAASWKASSVGRSTESTGATRLVMFTRRGHAAAVGR